MIPLKTGLTDLLQEPNQKIWLGSTIVMQVLGFFADNAVAMIGILEGSVIPLFMSIRSQRQKQKFEDIRFAQEMEHKKRMDDIVYEEAKVILEKHKKNEN